MVYYEHCPDAKLARCRYMVDTDKEECVFLAWSCSCTDRANVLFGHSVCMPYLVDLWKWRQKTPNFRV